MLPPAAAFKDSTHDLQALEEKFQKAYVAPEVDLHAGELVMVGDRFCVVHEGANDASGLKDACLHLRCAG